MKLYNTLSRSVEDFQPLKDTLVTFYQCGPTVYWTQHIGNLRAMVMSDLMRRTLSYAGYKPKFVRNYTDVGHLTSDEDEGEDKMDKGAKREGLTPIQIADKYIKQFETDIARLNIQPPNSTPRASQYIDQILDMVKALLDTQHAYTTPYAVYFDVGTFKDYNKLNKQKLELNQAGKGKGVVEDPHKRHFSDFALWFFKKGTHAKALQTWPSPWGEGFPGWHIECSVMAKSLLGDTIDIHMGGVEHIPIHHTNEIAQSESANGVRFVNYWLHNEHLVTNDKKMAKSEGTSFTLDDILKRGYDPLDLRYFFLNAHYRSKQNFTWEALNASQEAYHKLKETVLTLKSQNQRSVLSEDKLQQLDEYRNRFIEAVTNDFQIPQALAVMWEMLKSNIPSRDKLDLLLEFDQVFGLKLNEVEERRLPMEIEEMQKKINEARLRKDFQTSDKLRKLLQEKGYEVKDTPSGTIVRQMS